MSSINITTCTGVTAALGLHAADTGLHAADTGLHAADIFCIEEWTV